MVSEHAVLATAEEHRATCRCVVALGDLGCDVLMLGVLLHAQIFGLLVGE